MKIGIISEFKLNTVNYGNQLQTYALNSFLRKVMGIEIVESIVLGEKQSRKRTGVCSVSFFVSMTKRVLDKIASKVAKKEVHSVPGIEMRMKQFHVFQEEHIPMKDLSQNEDKICDTDYDAIIVGSDVVWSQASHYINRIKFLDFETQKQFQRISYAASLGYDYIPKENIKYIRKYLKKFVAISVRENSTVEFLNSIGVTNVSYCLDPTLLLTKDEWTAIEEKPVIVPQNKKYIFTYLLGSSAQYRQQITAFAAKRGYEIITIPYANGVYIAEDDDFGDMRFMDCSIGNWLWLIHHAEYVITDSFHGTVLSSIFEKRFVSLKRIMYVDINNRIQDYLCEIGQMDKALSADHLDEVESLVWDYDQINKKIEIRKRNSIAFLRHALGV